VPIIPPFRHVPPVIIPDDIVRFVKKENFDEVILTGGEPMLDGEKLVGIAQSLRKTKAKIYVYTALIPGIEILNVLKAVDGLTISLHKEEDLDNFFLLADHLNNHPLLMVNKSLRLNVFKGINISRWDVMHWEVKKNVIVQTPLISPH
jgi:organic radical activating enzyme